MSIHAMIDLETFGTKPDCVITSLGVIKFDPYTDTEPYDGLYLKLDIDEQNELNRSVDDDTMAWWGKQEASVRNEALSEEGRTNLTEALSQINKSLVGVDKIWAQGPVFDIAILEHLYRQLNTPTPWNFWQIQDSRTLFNLMPVDPRKAIQEDLHNALADCYYQAKCVQQTFKHFRVTKR